MNDEEPLPVYPPGTGPLVEPQYRYPGPRPFDDTDADQKGFFGREAEADEFVNLMLSTNLLVLFGSSGLGKTSLLRARVFPLLRRKGLLPLPVSVKQPGERLPLLEVCWREIEKACSEQNVDYTPGEKTGLWEFFKTAIFWKEADLQQPVLIFDQFEELFDVYDRVSRRAFATELGELLARIEPDRVRARRRAGEQLPYGETPPRIKVLLSIREDHLGQLEEFSEYLPGIMHSRFRLLPLVREQAARAITGPARLEDKEFGTLPFDFSGPALKEMLKMLAGDEGEVEPLLLQVLCTRIEQIVATRQKSARRVNGQEPKVMVQPQDLGGQQGLQRLLRDFYRGVISDLPRRQRRRARKVCADELVATDRRRRLLIRGADLIQDYHMSQRVLDALVNKHIMRVVSHLGSFYYELSHDALVQPVLNERPWQLPRSVRIGGYVLASFAFAILIISVLIEYGASNSYYEAHRKLNELQTYLLKEHVENIANFPPSKLLDQTYREVVKSVVFKPGLLTSSDIAVDNALVLGKALRGSSDNFYQWKGNINHSETEYRVAIWFMAEAVSISLHISEPPPERESPASVMREWIETRTFPRGRP